MNSVISHINSEGIAQSNDEHQQGVAARAESFAEIFDMGDCGRIMGLLHDEGTIGMAKVYSRSHGL